jgi:COP9 signalosome complex subunit 3
MAIFDAEAIWAQGGGDWRQLVELLYQSAVHFKMFAAAVTPIRNALERIDPSGGTFTSLHTLFLRIVLASGIYEAALPIIDRLIHSFPPKEAYGFGDDLTSSDGVDSSEYITLKSGITKAVTERDVQEYYLLAAMICIGVGRRKWEDALLYLEMVITSPSANTATGYMLEAYRKYVLLFCLTRGTVSVVIRRRSRILTIPDPPQFESRKQHCYACHQKCRSAIRRACPSL